MYYNNCFSGYNGCLDNLNGLGYDNRRIDPCFNYGFNTCCCDFNNTNGCNYGCYNNYGCCNNDYGCGCYNQSNCGSCYGGVNQGSCIYNCRCYSSQVALKDSKELPFRMCFCYKGIAFDGNCFYLTLPDLRKVAVCDRCMRMKSCIDVEHRYKSLCFDSKLNVFWATLAGEGNVIVKLNHKFEELARITIDIPKAKCNTICSVSYDCCKDQLIVVISGNVYAITKQGCLVSIVEESCCCKQICAALSLCPYCLIVYKKDGCNYLSLTSPESCCDDCEIRLPKNIKILDLVLGCQEANGRLIVYAVGTKNGECNQLLKLELCNVCINSCNMPCPSCCGWGCGCNNNCNCNNNCGCGYTNGCGASFGCGSNNSFGIGDCCGCGCNVEKSTCNSNLTTPDCGMNMKEAPTFTSTYNSDENGYGCQNRINY